MKTNQTTKTITIEERMLEHKKQYEKFINGHPTQSLERNCQAPLHFVLEYSCPPVTAEEASITDFESWVAKHEIDPSSEVPLGGLRIC